MTTKVATTITQKQRDINMGVEEPKIILPHLANNTGNNEWYTPPTYIEAVRNTMGSIDLDPASCEIANQNVKATRFFSKEEDGLTKVWAGNIWLNPPYSKGLLSLFVDKLIESCFQQAIVLVHNCTETGWFRKLVDHANCIVFTDHRINFLRPDGTSSSGTSTRGQAFFYFGDNEEKFFTYFQQFGWGTKL